MRGATISVIAAGEETVRTRGGTNWAPKTGAGHEAGADAD
jgi:hypothetical protein